MADQVRDDEAPGGAEASLKRCAVLIVGDETAERNALAGELRERFGLIESTGDLSSAGDLLARCRFDLVILSVRPDERRAVEWAGRVLGRDSATSVICIASRTTPAAVIEAMRAGVADFLLRPYTAEQVMDAVQRCMQRAGRGEVRPSAPPLLTSGTGLVGRCETMRNVTSVIRRIAPMPTTVLIEGESGTGKELAARAIHEQSGRTGSFVPINCGAIAPELMESEIFGHVRGAFTGAHQAREGLFAHADRGTVLLDEISEMPLSMQVHLLRVLEERRIRPVGSNREVPVDVRIVAASNRELGEEVACGRFREDLFYRLNVMTVRIPPLRDRLEDLPLLVDYFVRMLSREMGIDPTPMNGRELGLLRAHDWPGNVRELRNVIERCLLLGKTPDECLLGLGSTTPPQSAPADEEDLSLEAVEKRHILRVLDMHGGNKSAASRQLRVSRKTLERKVRAWRTATGITGKSS